MGFSSFNKPSAVTWLTTNQDRICSATYDILCGLIDLKTNGGSDVSYTFLAAILTFSRVVDV